MSYWGPTVVGCQCFERSPRGFLLLPSDSNGRIGVLSSRGIPAAEPKHCSTCLRCECRHRLQKTACSFSQQGRFSSIHFSCDIPTNFGNFFRVHANTRLTAKMTEFSWISSTLAKFPNNFKRDFVFRDFATCHLQQQGEPFGICSDLTVESVYDAICQAYISDGSTKLDQTNVT